MPSDYLSKKAFWSTFKISNNTNSRSVNFGIPGGRVDYMPTMHIQPGTMFVSTNSEGNLLLTFDAYEAFPADASYIDSNIEAAYVLRDLFDEAQKSVGGLRRRVTLTSAYFGGFDNVQSMVLGGSISRQDNEVIDRWRSRAGMLYTIQIICTPYGEHPPLLVKYSGLESMGGIKYLPGMDGTTNGRVERISITPSNTSGYQWRHLWIGIKENKTATGGYLESDFFSTIAVNNGVAKPTALTSLDPYSSTSAIGGAGSQLDFVYPAITSYTDFTKATYASVRSQAAWQPRFYVEFANWNTNAAFNESIPGKYRFLTRVSMPPVADRKGSPTWAIRARLVYGTGNKEYQEISRGPELYIPNDEYGNGSSFAWYDSGVFEIGVDYATGLITDISRISIVIDAALLGIETDASITTGSQEHYDALTDNYLRFDDFGLLPADSSIFIKLPQQIGSDERLELTIDEFGEPHCYVVGPVSLANPYVRYAVPDVSIGDGGFTVPPAKGGALVVFADGGPTNTISTSASFKQFDMTIRPRSVGGVL